MTNLVGLVTLRQVLVVRDFPCSATHHPLVADLLPLRLADGPAPLPLRSLREPRRLDLSGLDAEQVGAVFDSVVDFGPLLLPLRLDLLTSLTVPETDEERAEVEATLEAFVREWIEALFAAGGRAGAVAMAAALRPRRKPPFSPSAASRRLHGAYRVARVHLTATASDPLLPHDSLPVRDAVIAAKQARSALSASLQADEATQRGREAAKAADAWDSALRDKAAHKLLQKQQNLVAPTQSPPTLVPPMQDASGIVQTEPRVVAQLLRDQWESKFAPPVVPAYTEEEWADRSGMVQEPPLPGLAGSADGLPSHHDIALAVQALKLDSAPGLDGITPRMLACAVTVPDREPMYRSGAALCHLVVAMFATGVVPPLLRRTELVCIPKRGRDATVCANLRPLGLMSSITKVLDMLWLRIVRPAILEAGLLPPSQVAFLPQEECIAQGVLKHEVILRRRAHGLPTFRYAYDINGAFDATQFGLVLHALRRLGVGDALVRVSSALMTNLSVAVRVGGGHAEPFVRRIGVAQGSPSSPFFYLVATLTFSRNLPLVYVPAPHKVFERPVPAVVARPELARLLGAAPAGPPNSAGAGAGAGDSAGAGAGAGAGDGDGDGDEEGNGADPSFALAGDSDTASGGSDSDSPPAQPSPVAPASGGPANRPAPLPRATQAKAAFVTPRLRISRRSDGLYVASIEFADDGDMVATTVANLVVCRSTALATMKRLGFDVNDFKGSVMVFVVDPKDTVTLRALELLLKEAFPGVPVVRTCTSLGVALTIAAGLGDGIPVRAIALSGALHAVFLRLRNPVIPLYMRAQYLTTYLLPKGTFGGEIFGGLSTSEFAPLDRAYTLGIAMLALGRRSLPHGMSATAAWLELGVMPPWAVALGHKARALVKYQHLRSNVARVTAPYTDRGLARTWSSQGVSAITKLLDSAEWRFRSAGLAKHTGGEVRAAASAKWFASCKHTATRRYLAHGLDATAGYVRQACSLRLTAYSPYVDALFRSRTGLEVSTAQRAHANALGVPGSATDACPTCNTVWAGSEDSLWVMLQHLLFVCLNTPAVAKLRARWAFAALRPTGVPLSHWEALLTRPGGIAGVAVLLGGTIDGLPRPVNQSRWLQVLGPLAAVAPAAGVSVTGGGVGVVVGGGVGVGVGLSGGAEGLEAGGGGGAVVAVAGALPSPLTAADVRLPVFVVVGLAVLDAVREHRRLIADGESTEPHVDDSDEEDT